jgi:hypothetical protein
MALMYRIKNDQMVSALTLIEFELLKLSGVLLLFLHERLVSYTQQSSHIEAIHASKQTLIRNNTPKQLKLVNNYITVIYTLIQNYRNKNHLNRS